MLYSPQGAVWIIGAENDVISGLNAASMRSLKINIESNTLLLEESRRGTNPSRRTRRVRRGPWLGGLFSGLKGAAKILVNCADS
jgi:hypothetical protein